MNRVTQPRDSHSTAGGHPPAVPKWHPATLSAAQALAPGEVHVWLLSVDCDQADEDSLYSLLSHGERSAIARVPSAAVRRRRAMSRAWRRLVLAPYAGEPAASLRFGSGRSGKPALMGDASWLRFSVAHHERHVLLSVASELEVGVDLEAIPAFDSAELGAWLSCHTAAPLGPAPPAASVRALAECWVRLEARAKLSGRGLARETAAPDADAPWLLTFSAADDATGRCLLGALACSTRPARKRWLRLTTDPTTV